MSERQRFHEGERVVLSILDRRPGAKPLRGFVLRDAPPYRVVVHLDSGARVSVDRGHVRRDR